MNQSVLLSVALLFSLGLSANPKEGYVKKSTTLPITKEFLLSPITQESMIRARVNYYVDQQSSGDVTPQILLNNVGDLLDQASNLKKASSVAAKESFSSLDLQGYFQEFASISYLARFNHRKDSDSLNMKAPLTPQETDRIQVSVYGQLDAIADKYNNDMQKFVGTITEYYAALQEEPEMTKIIAMEINKGNYYTNREMVESIYVRPSPREIIIKDMIASLVREYIAKVQIPSGNESYQALLPTLPKK